MSVVGNYNICSYFSEMQSQEPHRQVEIVIADNVIADGDIVLLRVVMENLLSNAWKYTSKRPNARIEFGSEMQNGKTVYFVRDNGAGFDMSHADKLLGIFQRMHSENDYPGTGVGLATVQRIINRHNGWVRAEAQINKGATFYLTVD